MTTKILRTIIVSLFLLLSTTSINATQLDLTSWVTNNSFNFSGGQPGGEWTVQSGGDTVFQSINGDPTLFMSPGSIGNISGLSGTFKETSSDDDFVGFVFGFQDTGSFYLFDWKQGNQSAYGANASQGITLKRIDSVPTTQSDLWSTASVSGITTQLYHNSAIGRSQNVEYTFNLDRDISTGEISIALLNGTTTLDSFTVTDSTYLAGQFGFYNYSEDSVTYSGFQADEFQHVVPEPSTIFLFGIGLLSLAGIGRRKK